MKPYPENSTRALFRDISPDYSPSNDPWGNAMGAMFAVCDALESGYGVSCPAAWQFRQSPMGADTDSYEYQAISELRPSERELLRLGWFLHRLTYRIRAAGRDY